jgi:hypothetical protein
MDTPQPPKEFAHCFRDIIEAITEISDRMDLLERVLFDHLKETVNDTRQRRNDQAGM